jgi:hypothetical protein
MSITGASGKDWAVAVGNKRVQFLVEELKNGGRGLTWQQLRDLTSEKIPGASTIAERVVKKIAYGIEKGIEPQTMKQARTIMLPAGPVNMKRWETAREEIRRSMASEKKARSHAHKPVAVVEKEVEETSLETIRRDTTQLPDDVNKALDLLKAAALKYNYGSVTMSVHSGEAHVAIALPPPTIFTTR